MGKRMCSVTSVIERMLPQKQHKYWFLLGQCHMTWCWLFPCTVPLRCASKATVNNPLRPH